MSQHDTLTLEQALERHGKVTDPALLRHDEWEQYRQDASTIQAWANEEGLRKLLALATQPAQAQQSEQEVELRRSLAAAEATISERNAEIIDLHKRLKAQAQQSDEVTEAWCQANPGLSAKLINQLSAWLKQRQEAQAKQSEPNSVPMPQNEDQAAAMAMLGTAWLRDNAPHRLAQQVAGGGGGHVVDMKYGSVLFYRQPQDQTKPYLQLGTKLYTAPQRAPVVPDALRKWHEAYGRYLHWNGEYNRKHAMAEELNVPFPGPDLNKEYQEFTSAKNEAHRLQGQLHEAITAMLAATPTPPAQAAQQGDKA